MLLLELLTCGDSASSILYHSFLTKFSLSRLIDIGCTNVTCLLLLGSTVSP